MNSGENTIKDPQSIITFYKLTCEEINNVQKAKLNTVIYTVAINILAVAFIKLVPAISLTGIIKYLIISIISLVAFVSTLYLINFQSEIMKYDFRLRRIYKHLPSDKYLILEKMSIDFSTPKFYFFGVLLPYISVIFLVLVGAISLILF